jgi:hypothetical protein
MKFSQAFDASDIFSSDGPEHDVRKALRINASEDFMLTLWLGLCWGSGLIAARFDVNRRRVSGV